MDFAANFTAIDFETANRRPDSACQLAAVVVREGRIIDQAMWMIRPQPLYFSRLNIQIHGITPQQVKQEPIFGELWPQIAERIGDDCLVAHNASFDIGVLLACLRAHRQSVPEIQFTCTRAIARRTWPHHRRFGLQPLADCLGIRFRHHDALEDSITCAKILLAAGIDREAKSLPDLEKRLRLSRGKAGDWGYRGPRGNRGQRGNRGPSGFRGPSGRSVAKRQWKPPAVKRAVAPPFLDPGQVASPETEYRIDSERETVDLQRLMIRAEFIRPLTGKSVVFSGRLRTLSRPDAEQLATRLGGTCQDVVCESTDLLVVGSGEASGRSGESAAPVPEEEEAQRFQAEGKTIRIVNEDEFLGLLISQAGTG